MNGAFIVTKLRRVILVGKNEYADAVTEFTHDLKSNELIFHFSGRSTITFNGKTFLCKENTLRFLPKGENKGYRVEREELGECIDVFFDTDQPVSEEAFALELQSGTPVANLFRKLFSVWVAKNEGYYFKSIAMLYEIFALLQQKQYLPEDQYNTIRPAVAFIHEQFLKEKISIPLLAKRCGISESYLKKLFAQKFGISPLQYIIGLRINHACDLLRSEGYSVMQAAELCGYQNAYFFSRQFKKYMGISPSDFIKKYRSSK